MRRLFWTSGWDSTYRLLDLVIVQKQEVEPVYFINPQRISTGHEREAQKAILKSVEDAFEPTVSRRIAPVRFFQASSVDARLEQAKELAHALRTHTGRTFGDQYCWLHAVAQAENLTPLELGIVTEPSGNVGPILRENSIRDGDAWIVDPASSTPGIDLFRPFRFPILHLEKPRMRARAKKFGFYRQMKLTHFCHRPQTNGKPCGTCAPCRAVHRAGLGSRLHWKAHLRRVLSRYRVPLRRL